MVGDENSKITCIDNIIIKSNSEHKISHGKMVTKTYKRLELTSFGSECMRN